ncbi:MAG: ABC transporter substrate-binding protein [Chloroflexota bacterium]
MLKHVGSLCLGAAMLVLAGCGGGGQTAAASTAASPSSAAASSPALSGQITFYSAGPAGLSSKLGAAFTKKTGVKVNLFQGTTGGILARLQAEKAHPQADVVVLADWSAGLALKSTGEVRPYVPAGANRVPAAYQDAGHAFVAQGMSGLTIVYNKGKVADPPKEWNDLLQGAWKGKVTMPDPAASGSAYTFVAGFLKHQGEAAGWQYFTQLKTNGLIVPGSNAKALAPVISGGRSAMVAAVDHTAYAAIARGEKLAVVYPRAGTILSPRPLLILKSSQRLTAAKAFADFVLSKEGQKLVANAWIFPARSDVPVKTGHATLSDVKVWPSDWQWDAQHRASILSRFTSQVVQ